MAKGKNKVVGKSGATYEIVGTDVHNCGDGFLAIQKTVSRGEGKEPKVKKLVFNKDDRAALSELFA